MIAVIETTVDVIFFVRIADMTRGMLFE